MPNEIVLKMSKSVLLKTPFGLLYWKAGETKKLIILAANQQGKNVYLCFEFSRLLSNQPTSKLHAQRKQNPKDCYSKQKGLITSQ